MTQELATQEKNNGGLTTTFSLVPRNLEEAMKFADIMAKSDLVPKDYKGKPGNILVAMQKGFEVGLSPMAALESIAVINGRASLWGDGLLAIVMNHPAYEWHTETFDDATMTATFSIKRKGHPVHVSTFSKADAMQAKTIEWIDNKKVVKTLWDKDTYQSYPKRMLPARARGFGCRDKFADALKGMISAEEALDIPASEPPPGTAAVQTPTEQPKSRIDALKEKLASQMEETIQPELSTAPAPAKPVAEGPDEITMLLNCLRATSEGGLRMREILNNFGLPSGEFRPAKEDELTLYQEALREAVDGLMKKAAKA